MRKIEIVFLALHCFPVYTCNMAYSTYIPFIFKKNDEMVFINAFLPPFPSFLIPLPSSAGALTEFADLGEGGRDVG